MSLARDSGIIESLAYFKRIGLPIVAPATSSGGPVAVLRLSGNNLEIFQSFLGPFQKSGTFCYRSLPYKNNSEDILDKVLLLFFQNPHSFTGEDVIEIHLHGVYSLVDKVQLELLNLGASKALPGEFSFRAVHNGKMTLPQAEALHTALSTEAISGKWASKLLSLNDKNQKLVQIRFEELLGHIRAARGRVEAAIDFPEAVEEQSKDFNEAKSLLLKAKHSNADLLSTYYNFVKSAGEPRVVILGAPNAGKSTFLNALLGSERAIVSSVAGTTRDVVEARLKTPSGLWMRFLDTAGLRQHGSTLTNFPEKQHFELEKKGIDLGLESADLASIIIWIRKPGLSEETFLLDKMDGFSKQKQILEIYSHDDLLGDEDRKLFDNAGKKSFNFNNLTSDHRYKILCELEKSLLQDLSEEVKENFDLVISRRQGHLLSYIEVEIERALQCLDGSMPIELCATHLFEAESLLCRCQAQGMGEAYIEEIFKQFCLGK